MIAISADMIFNAARFSVLFGACLGLLYTIFLYAPIIFFCVPKRKENYTFNEYSLTGFWRHVFDYFFVLFAGIVYFVFQYVFVDGVNVFLLILLLILSAMVTKGIIKTFFAKILNRKR